MVIIKDLWRLHLSSNMNKIEAVKRKFSKIDHYKNLTNKEISRVNA